MEGHFALALEGLTTSASSVPFASSNFNASLISLEIAYCQYKIGRAETAIETSRQVENDSLAELDIDDRFVASCMLLEMSAADPRFGSPELLASQHHELREAYLKSRSDLTALVKKFCDETLGPREAV
jgi:hypothetical protein